MNHAVVVNEINGIRQAAGRGAVGELRREQRLREDLELDSLDLAELTVRLQAQFGVDVFARRNLITVGDLIDELESR
jgi:acyl carrier protein